MIYMNVLMSDLLKSGILTQENCEFLNNLRIPYPARDGIDSNALFREKQRLDGLIKEAIASGVVKEEERESFQRQRGPQIISDYISGPGGAIQSQADGKMYDSKSQYYKAVKAAGCVVLGTDAPTKCKEPEYNICEKTLKRDINEAIQQLGG